MAAALSAERLEVSVDGLTLSPNAEAPPCEARPGHGDSAAGRNRAGPGCLSQAEAGGEEAAAALSPERRWGFALEELYGLALRFFKGNSFGARGGARGCAALGLKKRDKKKNHPSFWRAREKPWKCGGRAFALTLVGELGTAPCAVVAVGKERWHGCVGRAVCLRRDPSPGAAAGSGRCRSAPLLRDRVSCAVRSARRDVYCNLTCAAPSESAAASVRVQRHHACVRDVRLCGGTLVVLCCLVAPGELSLRS